MGKNGKACFPRNFVYPILLLKEWGGRVQAYLHKGVGSDSINTPNIF